MAIPSMPVRTLCQVMRFTGSRVRETTLLTWACLHHDRIVFRRVTTKTSTTREPLIGPRLAAELVAYREWWCTLIGTAPRPSEYVFPSRTSTTQSISPQAVDKALRKAIRVAGLPTGCSTHTFRRSLATTMAMQGIDLKTVQRFTGHTNLNMLARYIDVSPERELSALATIGG
ncbi:site-specific integrase [Cyanobium sp. CH-040]|nr:site-specific integrase [Cyanobium sp. CH-040]